MNKTMVPLILVMGLLSGCDSSSTSEMVKNHNNATAAVTDFTKDYGILPKKIGGTCGFDQFHLTDEGAFISGWAVISAKDGSLAEATVVGVSTKGNEKFFVTSKHKREDVVKYFKNPALIDSGFSVYMGKADVVAKSKLALYQVFQGSVYTCGVTATL